MAGGMAKQGMIPVFAVYSSFLQRGYDQLIHDISLCKLHAVFAVDRAGLVGADGETHHGIFDVGYLSSVPGMKVYSPANFAELHSMLRHAVLENSGSVTVRYPRGVEGAYKTDWDGSDFSCVREGSDCAIVTYGLLTNNALAAAELLAQRGISAAVWKLHVVAPLDEDALVKALAPYGAVLIAEEAAQSGGAGEHLLAAFARRGERKTYGLANLGRDIPHQGTLAELHKALGLDAEGLAERVKTMIR